MYLRSGMTAKPSHRHTYTPVYHTDWLTATTERLPRAIAQFTPAAFAPSTNADSRSTLALSAMPVQTAPGHTLTPCFDSRTRGVMRRESWGTGQ